MEWLEAAVAFAVVMMVFSTIVAVIVESAHMIFRLREKGLRRFMEVVYKDLIHPRFPQTPGGTSKEAFVMAMTRSRFQPVDEQAPFLRKVVGRIVNAKELKNLGTGHFIARFTELPEGRQLIADMDGLGKPNVDAFLKDLARRYEEWGASATDYFARRARLASVIIAILLAFALNLNALPLFEGLLINKEVRDRVVRQADAVIERLERQQTPAGAAIAPSQAGQENAQAFSQGIAAIREHTAALRGGGIPFGWDYAPWNSAAWQTHAWPIHGWLLMKWGAAVLLTGLLIGLGGPFWFDTFRKLSALTGVAQAIRGPARALRRSSRAAGDATAAADQGEYLKIVETAARSRHVIAARAVAEADKKE